LGGSVALAAVKITKVRKRDGSVVKFDKNKIVDAIFKAAQSVGGKDRKRSEWLTGEIEKMLVKRFGDKTTPSVEEVQDVVEKVLIENGHAKVAKAYILYREKRRITREAQSLFIDVQNAMNEYLSRSDWRVNENSNTDYSFSGLMLHTAGKVIANYTLNEIYPPSITDAHKSGHLHLHNLYCGIVGYCSGWSLQNLLMKGFGGVSNKIEAYPAKHLDVVVDHMVNFMGCTQMEFAGAQAFSSVDTYLAPFVKVDNMTPKQIKQCIQRLVFSLNFPSRWGSQMPFTNFTFDWTVPDDLKDKPAVVGGKLQKFTYGDCQKEMDMINHAFLDVMNEGDKNGRVFSFPIPTYNLTKDFDWDSPNAKLLFEVTAKYGIPYFQNYIGSDLDPKSVRAMCCRLNLDLNELRRKSGGLFGFGDQTGSIGVVTINVNRLGHESKNKEEFFEKLKHFMRLAKDALEIKRKVIIKNLENGLMPYTKTYLGSFDTYFSTIGLCGMNEACLNLLGVNIADSEGKQFAIDTLVFMREQLKGFQQETGNLFNLEATPAESTTFRFAKLDKHIYPDIITAGEDAPFLTNSTHLPVDFTDDLVAALEHQNDIQPLYTGGTVFHTFMGERVSSPEACKVLVRKIASNTKLPYFTITPTFSICENHGHIIGKVPICPKCGTETEVYSRVVGFYRPTRSWNVGKKEEFRNRVVFDEGKSMDSAFKRKPPIAVATSVEKIAPKISMLLPTK